MRVTLIHNPEAGSSAASSDDLTALVRSAGYDVACVPAKGEDFARAFSDPGDLVLVAGGDGTVAKVARHLAGRHVPLAIIPLGTANNIAKSLGVRGTAGEVVTGLRDATPRMLDVATARAPWGVERFVESAGVGIFATMLRDAAEDEAASGGKSSDPGQRRSRGSRLREVLARSRARRVRVEADGEDVSGSYLLVAALNIRCIGPGLTLAPAADPGDGRLDLLLVREKDRSALLAYLEAVDQGAKATFTVPSRKVTRVRLAWNPIAGHLDDEPWPDGRERERSGDERRPVIDIEIADPSLTVMVPALLEPKHGA